SAPQSRPHHTTHIWQSPPSGTCGGRTQDGSVARQELQDPDPQSLVPHVGAQRFQARGEALVHRRGVCRAS
ncbi:unnamed protein product, partial [Heterosigma akashiwo]